MAKAHHVAILVAGPGTAPDPPGYEPGVVLFHYPATYPAVPGGATGPTDIQQLAGSLLGQIGEMSLTDFHRSLSIPAWTFTLIVG
jgi:hypothetical protein